MANPVLTQINTYNATAAAGVDAAITFSFAMPQGFEAWIPINIDTSMGISAAAQVTTFRSTDGGASYETRGTLRSVFPDGTGAAAAVSTTKALHITSPGTYLIQVQTMDGSASTQTVDFGTQEILTAYA